jgi:hypothetical protein
MSDFFTPSGGDAAPYNAVMAPAQNANGADDPRPTGR